MQMVQIERRCETRRLPGPGSGRGRVLDLGAIRSTALAFAILVGATLAATAQLKSPAAPAPSLLGYAYAKASPLVVSDKPDLSGGRPRSFEFGKAYTVVERTQEHVKLQFADGTSKYVRSAHVSVVSFPRWIKTTNAFNKAVRPRIRFWESSVKLNGFLAGIDTAGSQWDYEEYFSEPPKYEVSLPVLEADTLELLGGDRQVRIVSVMLPISRKTVESFEAAKTGSNPQLDVQFLLDVSGSTRDFLEAAMKSIAERLERTASLKEAIGATTVTTFGSDQSSKASHVGAVRLRNLKRATWHPAGSAKSGSGDVEPLIEGLVTLAANARRQPGSASVLIVLSGADVETSSYVSALGRKVSIETVDLGALERPVAIFAQVTPEPGNDLRSASSKLPGTTKSTYVGYSPALADDVIASLAKATEGQKSAEIPPESFVEFGKAAQKEKMIPFLPRKLTASADLPPALSYAAESEWYTVRLWLTVDPLNWTETTEQ